MGDVDAIYYRSSLELRLMKHLDEHPDVLNWNSEEVVIPYVKPSNKPQKDWTVHRYFVDMAAKIRDRHGVVKTYLIEVKPKVQCFPPKAPKTRKQSARYLSEMLTYAVNQAKWEAATEFCKKQGWIFTVMTDEHLRF